MFNYTALSLVKCNIYNKTVSSASNIKPILQNDWLNKVLFMIQNNMSSVWVYKYLIDGIKIGVVFSVKDISDFITSRWYFFTRCGMLDHAGLLVTTDLKAVFFFSAGMHSSKLFMHTRKLVRNLRSICQCILCFDFDAKTRHESTDKHVFRNRVQIISTYKYIVL